MLPNLCAADLRRSSTNTLDAMDLARLCDGLYEDSNALTTCVRLASSGDLLVEIECDDWEGAEKRRQFTITCRGHVANDVCIGAIGSIALHREHPLLLERKGRQGALYFSTSPRDPDRMFSEVWDVLSKAYGGWVVPSEAIERSPSAFRALLVGGYGLLLRGPIPVLENVRARLGNALVTQLIDTHVANSDLLVLVIDDHFVICREVEVIESGEAGVKP
jgi:hypothetical protein